ncbi:MAG: RNA polymerase sigma factor [Pseudomonadota bacterium]
MASDDKDLIAGIVQGDKAAMRALFLRHHAGLVAFLIGRGADRSEVDDVVQDAMLDVWRSASAFAGRSSVKTWVYTIARNKLIDRQRKGRGVSYVDEVPDVADTDPDPECALAASQEAGRVRACLDGLSPPQRSVIRLAFFEDLTYGEIAEVEAVPVGTIKTRVYHAKQLLLRCLSAL